MKESGQVTTFLFLFCYLFAFFALLSAPYAFWDHPQSVMMGGREGGAAPVGETVLL